MPDSIQERIMKKIAQAMSEITVANGYANTLESVQRHNQSGINLQSVPAVVLREGDCNAELEKTAYPYVRRRLEFFLVVMTRQDEEHDARSGGEILNSLIADIERRVAASPNWDGLAIMTDPPSYLAIDVEATTPHLSRALRYETVYTHLRTDPASQG